MLRAARLHADTVVDMVTEGLLISTRSLRVQSANRPFYEMFRTSSGKTENRLLYELGKHEWDVPSLKKAFAGVLARNEGFTDLEPTKLRAR